MLEDEFGVLFFLMLLMPVIWVLIRALYSQVQARILEFMLTLVVATMPIGLMLNVVQSANHLKTRVDWEKSILIGLFPAIILFGGSIWGLSAARRMNEQRTWPRIGFILIGWIAFPSLAIPFVCGTMFPGSLIFIPGVFLGIYPMSIAIRIERKCKQLKSN